MINERWCFELEGITRATNPKGSSEIIQISVDHFSLLCLDKLLSAIALIPMQECGWHSKPGVFGSCFESCCRIIIVYIWLRSRSASNLPELCADGLFTELPAFNEPLIPSEFLSY